MSPPTPAFSGTFSGSTAQFAVNSATGAITLAENDQCSSSPCNYSLPVTATPSNLTITPFTQTITITSSSGPSVPAAANAGCLTINGGSPTNGSCFGTLALNLDFTGATQSGYSNGTKFSATTQSNWLNCGGGTSTYNVMGVSAGNGSSASPTAPCSSFPITTDSGGSVLQMTITPSDVSAGAGSWTMASVHPIPSNFYAEIRLRIPNSNYNPSVSGFVGDFWSYTGGSAPPCFEQDFAEFTLNSNTGGMNTCPSSATQEQHNWTANGTTFDPTHYHTYGERVTGDGNGNISYCFYLDETQVNIETYISPITGNCGQRGPDPGLIQNYLTALDLLVQVGQEIGPPPPAISDNILYYVQWVRLWDCSNWINATPGTGSGTGTGGQCAGVVLSSNP